MEKEKWEELREKLFKVVSVGYLGDTISVAYDVIGTGALVLNLGAAFLSTFDNINGPFGGVFNSIEKWTVLFFAIDYILRAICSKCLYPDRSDFMALVLYFFSFSGIIDLLSFLPYYMPFFFPAGAAAFRMFRVARIFRLFRINAYYDSLNVITEVIKSKSQQLLSSVFIIAVMMLASSLCMYSLEHEAQPDVFENAFSGIWWAASTLLTVGYGDIYPKTILGKVFGILLAFLGVGIVAIPTGIISAGFVEQYTKLKHMGDYAKSIDMHFIKVQLGMKDKWVDKKIRDIDLPHGALIAMIQRHGNTIIPNGNVILEAGDKVVIGAEAIKNDVPMHLKEVTLGETHPWCDHFIRDLDFPRQTILLSIKRGSRTVIPKGGVKLQKGDTIIVISRVHLPEEDEVEV
ncbi:MULTISPECIES: ion transporter [unclassified Butyrivibrio]|uniref:ion transporter n=1 Tax=unclassified Butyrivibrio TaxID=2639466 RepID=UPI00041B0E40|nr:MULTISPECIES: ion transporter [unclassified Butyrivibrio]SEL74921.1 voltage-gated potassium channel [Butyrivibrio sp. ob235]